MTNLQTLGHLGKSPAGANDSAAPGVAELEQHRPALTGFCYRMLASATEADDAVQETLIRAWRGADRFEGRSELRSWLYRIATNVCLDMLSGRQRRARPMDLGPASTPDTPVGRTRPEVSWIQPIPDHRVLTAVDADPGEVAVSRETIRLAFVAALQHLPPRQRAILILCEVLRWKAGEVAELLSTTVASVNSALQRARSTMASADVSAAAPLDADDRILLDRYVQAFQSYDMTSLTALLHEDATQSMPPFEMWLHGRSDILAFWTGQGAGCRGSRLMPVLANDSPAFAQYKPSGEGDWRPWALQVLRLRAGRIAEFSFFLDTPSIFAMFGLPERLE